MIHDLVETSPKWSKKCHCVKAVALVIITHDLFMYFLKYSSKIIRLVTVLCVYTTAIECLKPDWSEDVHYFHRAAQVVPAVA